MRDRDRAGMNRRLFLRRGVCASAVGGIPIIGGAIASFLNGIGCVLAWVVVIIVIVIVAVLLLYIAWKGVEFVRG